MTKNEVLLISLADKLDSEGKFPEADVIDENFEEFLKLLEEGKLDFDFTFSSSPRGDYTSNRGREQPSYGISGPQ